METLFANYIPVYLQIASSNGKKLFEYHECCVLHCYFKHY